MVYLGDLKKRLLSTSSDRDITLYSYLNGIKHSIHAAPNDVENELCVNAFMGESGSSPLIKLRKVKPFKGFHYSNNLVLLIAAAKIDHDGEKSNIDNYLATHGYKEQLIINSALNTTYRVAKKSSRPVDSLAYLVQENERIIETDIQKCLSSVGDLYDLFTLEKAIAKSIFQSNEDMNLYSYKNLAKLQNVALRRVETICFSVFFLVLASALYFISPTAVGLVVDNWDTLEPIAYILDKVIVGAVLITGVVLATKVKSIKDKVRGIALRGVYKVLGIDYDKYSYLKSSIELE